MDCMKIMEFVYVSRSKLSKELADELLKVNLGDLKTTRLSFSISLAQESDSAALPEDFAQ